jgi:hypothetical protein
VVLEVVADAACIAHATGREDDVIAAEAADRLGVLNTFRDAQVGRLQRILQGFGVFQHVRVTLEDFGCLAGQRAVDENRSGRHLAIVHQEHQVGQHFLGAFDCERRDQQVLLACVLRR